MRPTRSILRRLTAAFCISLALAGVAGAQPGGGKRIALLVGVGQFREPALHGLEGPEHDVTAMRDVLVRRLGVAAADVHTLTDSGATKPAVLAELRKLKERSRSGDEIIVYFSSHGTSGYDPNMRGAVPLPYSSGALVTHEFAPNDPTGGLIVGRTDLLPIFQDLEQSGRSLWVISDSCYSGQQVRSAALVPRETLPGRYLPPPRSTTDIQSLAPQGRQPPLPYPYQKVIFFSASAEGEAARDIPTRLLAKYPTFDGKPHGAYTDALLRVLDGQLFADYDGNGSVDYAEVQAAVAQFMSDRGYGHVPQKLPALHQDPNRLAQRALMKVSTGAAPAASAAAHASLRIAATGASPALTQSLRSLGGIELVEAGSPNADLRLEPSVEFPDKLALRTPSGDLIARIPRDNPDGDSLGVLMQQSWVKRIKSIGLQHRRGLLHAEIVPSHFGGNFLIGEKIAFAVSPDRQARLLALNIDALGKVSVLYPATSSELAALPSQRALLIPGAPETHGVVVTEPQGMDIQILVAFDGDPPELQRLRGLQNLSANDPRLRDIETLLTRAKGQYTLGVTELRTVGRR
jgi:hypothetical protein